MPIRLLSSRKSLARVTIGLLAMASSLCIHSGCGTFVGGLVPSLDAETLVKQMRINCDDDSEFMPDYQDPRTVSMPKLIRLGDKAIPAIRAALKPEEPRLFLDILTDSLVKIGGEATIPALADVIALGDPQFSNSALWALRDIGTHGAVDVVKKVLATGAEEQVRYDAAMVLDESFGGREIIPSLKPLLRDPSPRIQKLAAAKINLITEVLNLPREEMVSPTNSPPSPPQP